MRKMSLRQFVCVFAAGLLALMAQGATYSIEGDRLIVTVNSGTESFNNSTALNAMNKNTVTDVIKRGAGTIKITSDNTKYIGDFHIEEGTWCPAAIGTGSQARGLGELSNGPGMNYARGIVYISDGATLELLVTGNVKLDRKRIVAAGSGVVGGGALRFNCYVAATSATFGHLLTLTGDTLVRNISHKHCYFNYSDKTVPKFIGNGNDLSFYNDTENGMYVLSGFATDPDDVGDIINLGKSIISFQNENNLLGNPSRRLIMRDDSVLNANVWRGRYEWTLEWDSTGRIQNGTYSGETADSPATNNYAWHGPVVLKKNLEVQTSWGSASTKNPLFQFLGPVTGEGGIVNPTVHTSPKFGGIALWCPTNSFAGKVVSCGNGIVEVHADGALPENGGGLVVTNGLFTTADSTDTFHLPVAEFYGDSVISNGIGSWKGIVKTGTGTLKSASGIGSERVEVRSGYFAPRSLQQSSLYAGLIYGAKSYSTNDTEMAAYESRVCFTNSVQLSPHLAYTADSDWRMWYPVMTYTGYIWNRSDKTQRWSFASIVNLGSRLYIDDQLVVNQNQGTSYVGTNTVTITPGPHRFEWRVYTYKNGISDYGAPAYAYVKNMINSAGSTKDSTTHWGSLSGLMYDPQGRGSDDYVNYRRLVDPGDGSLFTWDIPNDSGEKAIYPIGGYKFDSVSPSFGEVEFAEGTGLVNDGGTNLVLRLIGMPTVSGSGALKIGARWTVDVAEVLAGRKLVAEGSLTFGRDSELLVTAKSGAELPANVEYVIAEADQPIADLPARLVRPDKNRWVFGLSEDRRSLWIKRLPVGFSLIYRTVAE